MDQRTEYIRQDIDATREAMTDKLEQIESKVKGTVDDLKGSVENTVETVKENVKQAFDIKQQVSERPWTMLGASVVAGYVLGSLGSSDDSPSYRSSQYRSNYSSYNSGEPVRYYSDSTSSSYNRSESDSSYGNSYGSSYSRPSSSSGSSAAGAITGLLDSFGLEFDTLKDAAVVTVGNMLRDMMKKNLPQFAEEFERARSERDRQNGGDSGAASTSQSYDPLERSVGSGSSDATYQTHSPSIPNPSTPSSTIRNSDPISNADRNTTY